MTERPTFEEWFREFNSWGLTYDELLALAYTPGSDPGDVVFTPPNGKSSLTRYQCGRWIEFYSAAKTGWNASGAQCR